MNNENDYFFWLGADGTVEQVSETEFDDKQAEYREALDNWLNVRINDDLD